PGSIQRINRDPAPLRFASRAAPHPGNDEALSANTRPPALGAAFDQAQDAGEKHTRPRNDDDANHHLVGLEARAGNRDQEADAMLGAVHFADYDAHDSMDEAT